jgi:hypothetical protein
VQGSKNDWESAENDVPGGENDWSESKIQNSMVRKNIRQKGNSLLLFQSSNRFLLRIFG